MKIQCDVCNKEEAAVFCTADEAALCNGCDHRVHHANKLASKHPRFSLLQPPPKSSPLCDICQEKRAFLFCQQDRAILCRDCDVPIHTANDLTQKHNRFLFTGVKLSATPSFYAPYNSGDDRVSDCNHPYHHPPPQPIIKKPAVSVLNNTGTHNNNNNSSSNECAIFKNSIAPSSTQTVNKLVADDNNHNMVTGSTISEYLMEMLPGWHVEDLLDTPSSTTPCGFSKLDDGVLSFGETDLELESNSTSNSISSSEKLGIWVPQTPTTNFPYPQNGWQNGNIVKEAAVNVKANRKWTTDELFSVPQISLHSSIGSKRSRPSR